MELDPRRLAEKPTELLEAEIAADAEQWVVQSAE